MKPDKIAIIVHGALGRMGREVISYASGQPDFVVIGAVDKAVTIDSLMLHDGSTVPLTTSLETLLKSCNADVMVDFSIADASISAVHTAINNGIAIVTGTTGLSDISIAEITQLCKTKGIGGVIAPNFALGAVLLQYLSRIASPFFEHAEIIELHHDKKVDAPSGTALATAKAMASTREKPFKYTSVEKESLPGTRGGEVEGISIHSVRLPGLLAHQEVLFGAPGQTLTLRHDTISRECFMPGVFMAIRKAMYLKDLVYGLDKLMGLDQI